MTPLECLVGCLALACGLPTPLPDSDSIAPVVVSAEPGARQPQATMDENERVHVVYGVDKTVRYTVSRDGGRTFEDPRTVGSLETLALGMRRGPRVAVTPDAILVSAIGHQPGDLMAWRSVDGGQTWRGPVRVNTVAESAREGLHAMTARPDGLVFCVWLDLRSPGMKLFGARSTDHGESWEPDHLIYQSPDRTICECCHPSAQFGPDGELSVMWRNQIKGERDLFLAQSSDDGRTFNTARKLGQGTWRLSACPMDGGAIAVGPNGAIQTVWRRAGTVFMATPGSPERELGSGQQPWATWGPGGPYAVWLGGSAGHQPGPLWMQRPDDPGPRLLAERAGGPVLVAGPGAAGPVLAFWETDESIVAAQVSEDSDAASP